MKYLDPKADLTFKKIFSNHPDLLISLLNDPAISKALEEVRVSAFTDAELLAYDKFWDGVRVEKTLQYDSFAEGREEGLEEGMQKGLVKGREEGMQKGIEQRNVEIARKMLAVGMAVDVVMEMTGLSEETVRQLR